MKNVKFKRAYFFNENKTGFLGYEEWGVNIDESTFTAPSNKANSMSFIDYQYIGLKDKNGKEIYKGDLLKFIDDIEKLNPIIVGWSNKSASFILNRTGWAFGHWFGESCNPEECEIIGNIHQNSELLKD